MAKKSVFDRAEKALNEASADDCTKLISELEESAQADELEMAECRPPGEMVVGGNGLTYGELPTGPRYQRAAEAGEPTTELEANYNRAGARSARARQLIEQLQARQKTETERQAIEEAPGKAKDLIESLDDLLDQHRAARETLGEIHTQLDEAVKKLATQRERNAESPSLSIEQFYRAGIELSYQPPQRRQYEENFGYSKPAQMVKPLFGYPATARTLARQLIEPEPSLIERIRERLGIRTSGGMGLGAHHSMDTSDRAVKLRLDEWYTALVDTLTKGDLDAAKNLQADPAPTKTSEPPKVDGYIDLTAGGEIK